MRTEKSPIVLESSTSFAAELKREDFVMVPAQYYQFSAEVLVAKNDFINEWDNLEIDTFMGDGGKYRYRRYGSFLFTPTKQTLKHQPNVRFYQSLKINPLNGGIEREFAELTNNTLRNQFLESLIINDFNQLPLTNAEKKHLWIVGVHQIRIFANADLPGKPTPEGIHRDYSAYTVQHLIARENIEGGINYFYGNSVAPTKTPQTQWQQEDFFDSYYFKQTVWHSVSPIQPENTSCEGYRDVLLVDFTPKSRMVRSCFS